MKTIRRAMGLLMAIASSNSMQGQPPVLNSYADARATIYLDFDGQFVQGTIWNLEGPIDARPASLSNADITEIFNRVSANYQPFDINVTTDAAVFNAAPVLQRIRIIFTPTNAWYGNAAGVSFVGSFVWGDDTPAWVFTDLLGNDPVYVAACASHEIGHTLGLQHQSVYDSDCHKLAEYNGGEGSGDNGWAPIMGVNYYKNRTGWLTGTSTTNCHTIQNDSATIAGSPNDFGYRKTSTKFELSGMNQNKTHSLSWNLQSADPIGEFTVQSSNDGVRFQSLAFFPSTIHDFSLRPPGDENIQYRIKATTVMGQKDYYSNIVSLKNEGNLKKVQLQTTLLQGQLVVFSRGKYTYQLLDASGRMIGNGMLEQGTNSISIQHAAKGLLLLHWMGDKEQGTEKVIKQ